MQTLSGARESGKGALRTMQPLGALILRLSYSLVSKLLLTFCGNKRAIQYLTEVYLNAIVAQLEAMHGWRD